MFDTVLFDLDGTLLAMSQERFVSTYFKLLTRRLAPMGFAPEKVVDALWQGTAAMVKNDGTVPNAQRFWEFFSRTFDLSDEPMAQAKAACDDFYSNEFNEVRAILDDTQGAPARAVRALKAKGYRVALATNPLFPHQAVTSRLHWVGLTDDDFELTTNYENCGFCKPNLEYFRHVCRQLEVRPEQCLMVGNSVKEDMCAADLGMETYLVTNHVEGYEGEDYSAWRHGSIGDFAQWVDSLPNVE